MPRPSHDLTGRRFGRLAALRREPGPGPARWACQCSCGSGKTVVVDARSLMKGLTRSCGCLQHEYRTTRKAPANFRKKPKDLAGKRFGKLTAVEPVVGGRWVRWRCRCDCGGEALVITSNLTRGNTTSCGCVRRESGKALAARSSERRHRRYCRRCGTEFLGVNKQYFCCSHCCDRYGCETKWPKRKHYCPVCGKEFLGRAEKIYCDKRCGRVAANRRSQRRKHGSIVEQAAKITSHIQQLERGPGEHE